MGVTSAQSKEFIYEGSNQTQIASACHICPGSFPTLLKHMEEQGLVVRTVKDGNRRSYYVYLTDYGKAMAQKVQNCFREVETLALF